MTGLEPHPILKLPSQEQARAMGQARFNALLSERARRMMLERDDPLQFGFEPAVWHLVDDLLVDGNTVVLDFSRIQELMPPGRSATDIADVPIEIAAAAEIWIAGSNRSSKSEYAAKKTMKVLAGREGARTWSFADKDEVSIARQQPLFVKYMPLDIRRELIRTGKFVRPPFTKVKWTQANGFTESTFVLPGGAQHWFKNYKQEESELEGDQLDGVWLDELRNPNLLKIIRTRMGDRGGIIIVTFTSVDDNYSGIVNEYDKGSRTVLEVPAELLPAKDEDGRLTGKFENVPRIKVAGPGSDGDQRANIVYFHITDNPYYGYDAALAIWKKTKQAVRFGADRFYSLYRRAIRSKILSRVYGLLTGGATTQCPRFREAVHVVDHEKVPRHGTNYHIVDPVDGRNWFMLWVRIDPRGRWYVYREWPSYSPGDWPNLSPSAYVHGIGDPGPWALPGEPADGVRGPGQKPFGFGLTRYKNEILRCEGHPEQRADNGAADPAEEGDIEKPLWGNKSKLRKLPGRGAEKPAQEAGPGEEILERYMDSRYGATPTKTAEGDTTLIEQMLIDHQMEFKASSGKDIGEGVTLINEGLDYDAELPLGKFNPALARLNEPTLFISRQCPNTIYALKEWTGKDKQHGACKDPIDCLRYAFLADLQYIGAGAYAWSGGGSY